MTDFELIVEKVRPLFEASGFRQVESYRNFLRLDSQNTTVVIAYDDRERANIFAVGLRDHWHILDEGSLNKVFDYDKPTNNFGDFIVDFLKAKGIGILAGDVVKLLELDNYVQRQSEMYTKNLLTSQYFRAADTAWASRDYAAFIKAIDNVEKGDLPNSYKLKYKMANDRKDNLSK